MADFSVNATQLSAPQGAGANVISPVQQAAPDTSGFLSSPLVASVVDVFSKGLVATRKEEADKRKATIVNGYIREETTLNDAVASGQMTASQAAARSRATFNKYAAGYGEFIEDFEKAGKALRGFTEKGESEKAVETESKRREADITQAQQRGFVFPAGMSKTAQDSQIEAAKSGIRSEQALSQFYQANAEKRAQGTYDAGVASKEEKDLGFKLVNDIAGSNLTAFQDFAKTTSDAVRAGRMTPEMAQATLTERFTNISGALQAAARTNPELAAPYRTLFDSVYKIGQQMADPKSNLEALESQLKEQQVKLKLVAMSNPKTANLIVANQLLPNNLALQSRTGAIELLAVLSNKNVGDKAFTPQFIGDPEVEPEMLNLLKKGLSDLGTGKVKDKDAAKVQATNSVNEILVQTSKALSSGAPPEQLANVAKFFASPEYAGFVANSTISKEAAGAAKQTFQMLYEPLITKKVLERLNETLDREPVKRGGNSKTGAVERVKVSDAIDIKFSGSGIVFEVKAGKNLSPAEVVSQRQMLEGLRSAQAGVNQLIHIGAHLEGNTDYNKFWETNKHVYMPNIFPDPVQLSPGKVVDGYQYIGGPYGDKSSWKAVK
jgi:hypothetical protein